MWLRFIWKPSFSFSLWNYSRYCGWLCHVLSSEKVHLSSHWVDLELKKLAWNYFFWPIFSGSPCTVSIQFLSFSSGISSFHLVLPSHNKWVTYWGSDPIGNPVFYSSLELKQSLWRTLPCIHFGVFTPFTFSDVFVLLEQYALSILLDQIQVP